MEQRGQNGAADQNVREAIGINSTDAFAITLRTLNVFRGVARLIDTSRKPAPKKVKGSTAVLRASLYFSFVVSGAASSWV